MFRSGTNALPRNENTASPRWLLPPLRPGDDVTLDVDVTEARVSKSRPETGIVTFKGIARNARGQALCEMVSPIIISRREAAGRG